MTSAGDAVNELRSFFASGRRLALSGSSGVGKTTLATLLGALTGAPLHEEGAREWLAAHQVEQYWAMSPEQVAEMQLWLLERLETSTAQIFDRFSIDSMVFAERAKPILDAGDFEDRAQAMAQDVDLVIFMPYRSELLDDDGVRKPDSLYQLRTSAKMLDLIFTWGIDSRTYVWEHHRSLLDNVAMALGHTRS